MPVKQDDTFCTGLTGGRRGRRDVESVFFAPLSRASCKNKFLHFSSRHRLAKKRGEGGDLQKFGAGVRPMHLRSCRGGGRGEGGDGSSLATAAAFANFEDGERDIFANFSSSEATTRRQPPPPPPSVGPPTSPTTRRVCCSQKMHLWSEGER